MSPSKSLYLRLEVASCNCQPPTSGRAYCCSQSYANEMRQGRSLWKRKQVYIWTGVPFFKAAPWTSRHFVEIPLGWSATPASFGRGESNVKDENIKESWRGLGRRMTEIKLAVDMGAVLRNRTGETCILSLSGAMLLGSLASSWSNVIS